MVEYLTESVLARTRIEGSLVSYPRLLEVAMYHPQFLCHLVQSKLPSEVPEPLIKRAVRRFTDVLVDHSGRLLSLSMFALIVMVTFFAGAVRYEKSSLTEILGWSHIIGLATADIFKVLVSILTLSICNSTPFLIR